MNYCLYTDDCFDIYIYTHILYNFFSQIFKNFGPLTVTNHRTQLGGPSATPAALAAPCAAGPAGSPAPGPGP